MDFVPWLKESIYLNFWEDFNLPYLKIWINRNSNSWHGSTLEWAHSHCYFLETQQHFWNQGSEIQYPDFYSAKGLELHFQEQVWLVKTFSAMTAFVEFNILQLKV